MKVVREGHVLFGNGGLVVQGWTFDMQGRPYPTPQQQVACALLHIARKVGADELLTLEEELTFPLDVERVAIHVISEAMAQPQPRPRPWWAVWRK